MSIWNTNFEEMSIQFIPPKYRGIFWEELIRAFSAPIQTLYSNFAGERQENLKYLKYDSRTLVLEWKLKNDLHSGIYIVNHGAIPSFFYDQLSEAYCPIFNDNDTLSCAIYDQNAQMPTTHFTVFVPVAIQSPSTTANVSIIVNSYNHVAITYEIIYY